MSLSGKYLWGKTPIWIGGGAGPNIIFSTLLCTYVLKIYIIISSRIPNFIRNVIPISYSSMCRLKIKFVDYIGILQHASAFQ